MNRHLVYGLFGLLLAAAATEDFAQPYAPPTDKRPPGMNRPVVGVPNRPGPNPGRPRPPIAHRPPHRYRIGAYRRPHGYFFRRWVVGATLPHLFMAHIYWVAHGAYGLRPPPLGTRWVRVDNDALLVSERTGHILEVVRNVFY